MKHTNFFKNTYKHQRFVWLANGEAPSSAPPPAPEDAQARPANSALAAAEGERRAQAVESGDAEQTASAARAEAVLPASGPAAAPTATPPEQPAAPVQNTEVATLLKAAQENLKRFSDFFAENPQYKEQINKFIEETKGKSPQEVTAKKKAFFDSILDARHRELLQQAIETAPTAEEEQVLGEQFKDKMPSKTADIMALLKKGDINIREANVLSAILSRRTADDGDKLDSKKIIEALKKVPLIGPILAGIADAVIGLLKAFGIDIGASSKPAPKKKEEEKPSEDVFEKFEASPLGKTGDKQNTFKIKETYKKDKGLVIETAVNTQKLYAAVSGKITFEDNALTIEAPSKQKVIYKGVIARNGLIGETQVKEGDEIGNVKADEQKFSIQYFDQDGAEKDPQPLLKDFIEQTLAPAGATTAAPAAPAK